ncbi:Subtilisin-like protease SBT1.6 [Thalictrum thalictroides]|uniref:Subtilisin-like protease SBT1.6 n=1 Tax=Thalictrum thalictroides TaxID=46969 RepID=A0A7J6W8E6_THATH|nr:Subtilisin-like protease SBT1.6 [Thalictrum thalictroides]
MPFVVISSIDGEMVEKYYTKTSGATVDIKFQITELGTKQAPQVASFSSRGPSAVSPWTLKPDILAPGVNVLAAWAPNRGTMPIGDKFSYLLSDYVLVSGRSMSSPHAVGVAALLKSAHPDWSSAAIKSAMMTTADVIDNMNGEIIDMAIGMPATPLDFGAGHLNPNKALDPGLIYDIEAEDYINYLCALNYTSQQIKVITRRSNYRCDHASLDLNYPSFIVILNNTNTAKYVFKRLLTNVADSQSIYRATIWAPSGMKVVVEPMTLTFGRKYSKAEFTMKVEIGLKGYRNESDYLGNYGYLSWYEVDGKHVVRSPVVSAFAPQYPEL